MTTAAPPEEPGTPAPKPKPKTFLAPDALGRDLLVYIVDELKQLPAQWGKLSKAQQEQVITRLQPRTEAIITKALRLLLTGEQPACVATLERVTFGDGIKAALEVASNSEFRHELADKTGSQVIVVMVDPKAYTERMHEVKGEADQKQLFDDLPDTPLDLGPVDPPEPPDAGGSGNIFESSSDAPASGEGFELSSETPPPEAIDPRPRLYQLLAAKGADLVFADIEAWNIEKCVEAQAWLDGHAPKPNFFGMLPEDERPAPSQTIADAAPAAPAKPAAAEPERKPVTSLGGDGQTAKGKKRKSAKGRKASS